MLVPKASTVGWAVCHYQVARLWEDLVAVEPCALEPVPARIVDLLSDSERWAATLDELLERAAEPRPGQSLRWWFRRVANSSYLVRGPELAFVRIGSEIRVTRTVPGDEVGEAGVMTVNANQFAEEMSQFDRRLIDAMAARLDEMERERLIPPSTIEGLRLDHEERARKRYRSSSSHHLPTDWPAVLGYLEEMKVLSRARESRHDALPLT